MKDSTWNCSQEKEKEKEKEAISPWSNTSLRIPPLLVSLESVEAVISQAKNAASISNDSKKNLSLEQQQDEKRRKEREKRRFAVEAKKAEDAIEKVQAVLEKNANAVLSDVSELNSLVDAKLKTQSDIILEEAKNLKARIFRDTHLRRKAFNVFILLYTIRHRRVIKADRYYAEKITAAILKNWGLRVHESRRKFEQTASQADIKLKKFAFTLLKDSIKQQQNQEAVLISKIHSIRQQHVIDRWVISSARNIGQRACRQYRLEKEVEIRYKRSLMKRFFYLWSSALNDMIEEREANERQTLILKRAFTILNEEFTQN
jgi:hypothetical protein